MTTLVYTNIPKVKLIFDTPFEQARIDIMVQSLKLNVIDKGTLFKDYEPKNYYTISGKKGQLMKLIYNSDISMKLRTVKEKPFFKTIYFTIEGL